MEIVGRNCSTPGLVYKLQVQFSCEFKQPAPVVSTSQKDNVDKKKDDIEKEIIDEFSLDNQITLDGNSILLGCRRDYVEIELASCPLPRNQGPIIPGLDNGKYD